ncbi:glycogen/starch/alpha-glucan phosphorylase [Schinkia azotoformans]|uniref:glycogen/starch/alpha-glucan phosphorylase n=1 Tax=Schinkia azotoformans TaxID=1454 RepID=UPI002DBA5175|nr:glycogen/starch/alpha-glucan phosphorylase [Schinkia azotoformans]MEC1720594.1 glycogen/starch/alpha-glucan phosphorylase [Schinkia azotoformans]MED4414130.1 glycogen/starch/alpha-glucan phosphorylase [Schinkia azotoformans]
MFSTKDAFKQQFLEKYEIMYGKSFEESTLPELYNTLGQMVREYVSHAWIETNERNRANHKKQTYYFSIEFLLGRLLGSNLLNLGVQDVVEAGLKELGVDLREVEEQEVDAGLGNGGLGRLAACFLDSLASLSLPGHGVGIRYKHGLFDQRIIDGYQVELPEQWLRNGNVWEIRKASQSIEVKFGGDIQVSYGNGPLMFHHINAETVTAVPYDMPVIGYENKTINTLRLWSAEPSQFRPDKGDVMKYKRETEAISEFLYPDDSHIEGKILRLKQQYFLVSAGLKSIVRTYLKNNDHLSDFHNKVAIHINDTHPVLAIPELMRILMDEHGMGWEEAWHITTNTISYTNHTTLSEALEKWPISIFKPLLPRIYMIVEEINERYCRGLWDKYTGDWKRIEEMAIIAHGVIKMAHLAIVGSHSVNGVAKIHTDILKEREMKLFYDYYPTKFNNKTNGITHRRWLIKANPELARTISEAIGDKWIAKPEHLSALLPFANDAGFKQKAYEVKYQNKLAFARQIKQLTGIAIDEHSIFDVQVKRLHAYKRQLLNILHIMYLYNRLQEDSNFSITPHTFIFGAKASPGYYYAKKIIKLINTLAAKINDDPKTKDLLKVIFVENYRVSLAETIIPAADVSEQISTASKEASGTGNMKFMMNGAITLGTMDGANVEIFEEVGPDNIFTFGLTAEQVLAYQRNGGYRAIEYYHHDQSLNQVINQLINGFFPVPAHEFETIYDSLLVQNDEYFVLKDFGTYVRAHEKVGEAYRNRDQWLEKSIINIAKSGRFSSDRTIQEYADEIWGITRS